ncbi:MAG: alpha-L-arabinofuranosidase C-terminal domain-containing protein, partial [Pyrinomonadaceae bacterium]
MMKQINLHRRLRIALVICLLSASQITQAQTVSNQDRPGRTATIEINAANHAAYKIPRTIFGTFLEPIGNSIYGGLWAQVLENPSFEDSLWSAPNIRQRIQREPSLIRASELALPLPWEPLDATEGARYEPRWMDAANSSRSLLIMALPNKETGVRQQIYLPVERTLRYTGSLYAKHLGGAGMLNISLRERNHPERVLAQQQIKLGGDAWRRYEFALELAPNQVAPLDPIDFVIALANEERDLIDQAMLFPADNIEGMDPEMIALARDLQTPILRYGGNFTSAYHWRDGIGPMDQRVSMLNIAWGIPEYNHFGTDELLRFCRLINAEPQVALNLGSGTPEEAVAWVRYINGKWGAQNGLVWELGNELWGDFQTGYPTLPRIATRTKVFSEAVRRIDPHSRLIGTGADPDHFKDWNAAQLTNAPDAFQYLSTHFVVRPDEVERRAPTPDFIAQAAFALPVELGRRLRDIEAQVQADPQARDKVKVAFTEWLFYSNRESTPSFNNMGGAICTAGFLNMLMRTADFVPISDMTGLIEFGGIWKKRGRVYGVPAYWAFRMYSNADVSVPVETRTDVESYNITEGVRRLPNIKDVPYLDVVAALNDAGDKLTLFCVNRHLTRDIP